MHITRAGEDGEMWHDLTGTERRRSCLGGYWYVTGPGEDEEMWHDVNEGYSCSVISKYSMGILAGRDHSLFESKLEGKKTGATGGIASRNVAEAEQRNLCYEIYASPYVWVQCSVVQYSHGPVPRRGRPTYVNLRQ